MKTLFYYITSNNKYVDFENVDFARFKHIVTSAFGSKFQIELKITSEIFEDILYTEPDLAVVDSTKISLHSIRTILQKVESSNLKTEIFVVGHKSDRKFLLRDGAVEILSLPYSQEELTDVLNPYM